MKTKKNSMKYMAAYFAGLLLVACSSNEVDVVSADAPVEIRLNGKLYTVGADTRGIGPIIGTTPHENLPLDVFRANAAFGETYDVSNAIPGEMSTLGAITMTPAQYYPANPTVSTKLVALYPSGGIYNPSARTVTHVMLDGATDVMGSALIEGSRNTPITEMRFSHLLTQIKANVKAADDAAITAWGNVTNISVVGKKIGYVITLPLPTDAVGTIPTITTGEGEPTTLRLMNSIGGLPSIVVLTKESFEFYACAMFLPVESEEELELEVTTVEGGTQSLIVPARTFVAGTAYDIDITFTSSQITATATVSEWLDGGHIDGSL